MAVEAPAHVPIALRFGSGHLAEITMTIDTVDMCIQVRLVTEINEIRHQRNRHPLDVLVGIAILLPLLQQRGGCLDVVMASVTLGFCRQTRGLTANCSWMAKDAWQQQ